MHRVELTAVPSFLAGINHIDTLSDENILMVSSTLCIDKKQHVTNAYILVLGVVEVSSESQRYGV